MTVNTTVYRFAVEEVDYAADEDRLYGFPRRVSRDAEVEFDSSERWTAPLYEFVKFLSAHYGYNISNDVFVKGVAICEDVYSSNFAVDSFEVDLPSMKKKDKKKKKKKAENFFMGSADDWDDTE